MPDEQRQLVLIHANRRHLVRAATRLLGPADAEDAVQDAYVRALEAEALALNAAQAWLLTVVRNLAIDRLRRRDWLRHWLAEMSLGDAELASPSAEMDAALVEAAANALRLLAAHLTPADSAAVLLHEVFDFSHAEIAQASGKSEAASRQQLRRALSRLRQAAGPGRSVPRTELDPGDETVFRLCLQSLRLRDPQALWAMLRHPPIHAMAGVMSTVASRSAAGAAAPETTCGVVQVGGQLGLVLTLDGVTLCVVPLGVQPRCALGDALV